MDLKLDWLVHSLVSSVVFTTVGIFFFVVAFFLIQKLVPFSIRKEIEEDHNTAMAIVLAAIILGIALIVSAAVHG
jgi:putative membrane protein